LEALQLATDDVTGALNAWGDTLVAHLQDIPMRAREVALHGVRHGADVALAIAQLHSGYDLRSVEPGLPEGEDFDNYHDLVEDFEGGGDAVVNITSAEGVVNNIFFGP
jgi:hypothetical protein